jgi:hypothetical protein
MTFGELAAVLHAGYLAANGKEPGVVADCLYAMTAKAMELEIAGQQSVEGPSTSQEVISGVADGGDGGA